MTITFKESDVLNNAILAVACKEGHGNKTTVISRVLKDDPAIKKEMERISKKVKK